MKRNTLIIATILGLFSLSGCGESGYPILYETVDGVTQKAESTDEVMNIKYLVQTKDSNSAVNDIRQLQLKVTEKHPTAQIINVFIYINYDQIPVLNEKGERYTGIKKITASTCTAEDIKKYPNPAEYEKFRQEQLKEKLDYRLKDST